MKPVFEIYHGKRHYKIYADGRIEGMRNAKVINRIPTFINETLKAVAKEATDIGERVKKKMDLLP